MRRLALLAALALCAGCNDGRLSVDSSDPLGEGSGVGTIYFHRYAGTK